MSGILGLFPGETERLVAPPVPTAPRTAGERFTLEYESTLATGLYASAERNEYLELERERDRARQAGREPPPNYRQRTGWGNASDAYIGPIEFRSTLDRVEEGRRAWDEWAARENAREDGGGFRAPASADIRRAADARAAALYREAEDARRVGGGGFGGFLGTVFAAFSDPVNIATLPLGTPARALAIAEGLAVSGLGRAAARIGATAVGEAAAAAASQTFIETRAAPYRVSIGLPDTFGENVLEAAIGGAVLGGGLRGLVEGWRLMRGTSPAPTPARAREEADAAALAQEQIIADAYRPAGPEAHQAHTAAADGAMAAVEQGQLPGARRVRQGSVWVPAEGRAAEIEAGAPPATVRQRDLIMPGGRFNAFTPTGRSVVVEPQVVELESLIPSHLPDGRDNPAFPHAEGVQPRDRGAAPSQDQIRQIAAGLIPERLMPNREAGFGAPIIAGDQVVESGNGRVLALHAVFADATLAAQRDAYVAAVRQAGFDTEGYRQPVLVARRITALAPEERRAFVIEANNRATLAQGAAEVAAQDAGKLAPALPYYRSGEIDSLANAPFVRRFLQGLTAEERGVFIDAERHLTAEGHRRIRAGLMHQAYGDELGVLLTRFLETENDGFRNLAGALGDVAGDWARMRAAVRAGQLEPKADATAELASAVRALDDIRRRGVTAEDYVLQIDFERPPLTADAKFFLQSLHRDFGLEGPLASRPALRDRLRGYVAEVEGGRIAPDLLGEAPAPGEVMGAAARRVADTEAPPRPAVSAEAAPARGAFESEATPDTRPTFDFEAQTRTPPPPAAPRIDDVMAWKPGDPLPADIRAAEARAAELAGAPTDKIATPEREAMRDQVIDAVSAERVAAIGGPPAMERRALLVIGPPSAGKSTIIEPLAERMRALLIDSDDVKAKLPEFDGGLGAMRVHEESSQLASRLRKAAIRKGMNIALPLVGGDAAKLRETIRDLQQAGYHVTLVLNDLPIEKAAQRNMLRFRQTGRLVSHDYLMGIGSRPRDAYDSLREIANAHAHYSNDVARGQPPLHQGGDRLLAEPGGDGRGAPDAAGRAGDTPAEPGPARDQPGQGQDLTRAPAEPDAQPSLFGEPTDPIAIQRAALLEGSIAAERARAAPGVADADLAEARRLAAARDFPVPVLEVEGQPAAGSIGARALLDQAEDAVADAAEAGACLLGGAA